MVDFFTIIGTCLKELRTNFPNICTLSLGQNNFSFFNRKRIESPEELDPYLDALHQTRQDIADGTLIYDPEMTYMNFIVGDGDNVAFMKGKRPFFYYFYHPRTM
jgi:hypothetical protein